MAYLTIQFSRAAPVEWFDRWILDRSLAISRLAHCPFAHSDYVMDNGNLLGASDSPKAARVRGNPRGVAERPPDYQRFSIRRRARIYCTLEQKKAYEEFLVEQLGKPFDHDAVSLRTFLSSDFRTRDWRDPRQWYCHELLVRGYEEIKLFWWVMINVKGRVTANDHLLIINPIIDVEAFWQPIPGLKIGKHEI